LYLETGQGAAAEKELRWAMKLGVAKETLMLPLAEALALQNKYRAILDEIDVGLDLTKQQRAKLIAWRGEAWLGLGKFAKAEGEFERALEVDPESSLAKLGMAKLAFAKRDYQTAVQLVEEGLQTDSRDQRLWRFKAILAKTTGDLEKAEEAYSKAIEVSGNHIVDLAERAVVRLSLGKVKAAQADIEQLKSTAPRFYLTSYAEGIYRLKQGQLDQALESLEKAHRLNDKHPETLFYLGVAHLMKGNLQQAETYLKGFNAMYPGSVSAHLALAMVKMKLQDYQGAKSLLMPVLLSQPDNVTALNLIGRLEFLQGHRTEGLGYFKRIVELNPKLTVAKVRLGAALLASGKKQEGMDVLQEALQQDPELLQPEIMTVMIHLRDKEFDQARRVIERLKQKLPDKPLPLNLEAMLLMAQGKTAQAEAVLQQVLKLSPGDPDASGMLAKLAMQSGDIRAAESRYQDVLKAHPDSVTAGLNLARLELRDNKGKQAESRLQKIIGTHPTLLQPRLMLAEYYLRFGRAADAVSLLDEVRDRYPEHPRLLGILSDALIDYNQPGRALATAKVLVGVVPDKPLSHYILARAYAANHDLSAMEKELAIALQKNPDFFLGRLSMGRLQFLQNRLDEAQTTVARLAKQYPDHPEILGLMGEIGLKRGDYPKAREYFTQALAVSPQSRWARKVTESLWREGKQEAALQYLGEWIQSHPDDVAAHLMSVELKISAGKGEAGRKEIEALLETHPGDPRVLAKAADLAYGRGDMERAENLYQAALSRQKANLLNVRLALTQIKSGQEEKGLATLRSWLERYPQDDYSRAAFADALLGAGHMQEAEAQYRRILKDKPDSVSVLNNLAWLALEKGHVDEAEQLIHKAVELAPARPEVLDTLALVLLRKGDPTSAIDKLEAGLKLYPGNPQLRRRLAEAYIAKGDARGQALLDELRKQEATSQK